MLLMSPTYWISYLGWLLYLSSNFWSGVSLSFEEKNKKVKEKRNPFMNLSTCWSFVFIANKSSCICSVYDAFISFPILITPCFNNLVHWQILPLLCSHFQSVNILFYWFWKSNAYGLLIHWYPRSFCFLVLSKAYGHWRVIVMNSDGEAQ